MKKWVLAGALVFGLAAAAIHHDNLTGVWLLAWPLGGVVAWIIGRRRSYRAAFRVEAWRAEAIRLRLEDPETYALALAQASDEVRATRTFQEDPDSFVALLLASASDAGFLNST